MAIQAILADPTGRRMNALTTAWKVFEAQIFDPDPVSRHDAHLAFHQAIWSASENVLLAQLWPVVEAHMTIALAEDQRARPNPERSRGSTLAGRGDRRPGSDRIEIALQAHTVATANELIELCHSSDRDRPTGITTTAKGHEGEGSGDRHREGRRRGCPALSERGHDVVRASRTSSHPVDATDPGSIARLFGSVGTVDAVVAALGSAPYKPLSELSHDDFLVRPPQQDPRPDRPRADRHAVRGRRRLVHLDHWRPGPGTDSHRRRLLGRQRGPGGLHHGCRRRVAARHPDQHCQPDRARRGHSHHPSFPGFTQVPAAAVGQAFVKAVEGVQTGQVYALDGR